MPFDNNLAERDQRLDEALDFMLSKRLPDGAWKYDTTIAKLPVRLERQGWTSKRITLDAMLVQKSRN